MKRCTGCGRGEPEVHFWKAGRTSRSRCNRCFQAVNAQAFQRLRLERYSLTPERYDALLAKQGGRCAICRTDQPGGRGTWHVDHDHSCCPDKRSCGKCTRGLLCRGCNAGIGSLNDDPWTLMNAATYLWKAEAANA